MSREEVTRTSSIAESLPSDDGALTSSIILRNAQRFKRLNPINFSIITLESALVIRYI